MAQDLSSHPALASLVAQVSAAWPEHAPFLGKSFADRDARHLAVSNSLAEAIAKLGNASAGGLDALIADYRFLCEDIVLPEEIHFRRNGSYRLSTFAEAERTVYSDGPYMSRYMNGLLLSDVLWANHSAAFDSFVGDYLPGLPENFDHLEIGPGHGMFLAFAAQDARAGSLSAWDISETSIAHTRSALGTLGITKPVDLVQQDMFDASGAPEGGAFDSIVMSEILEHLEDPIAALKAASHWLRPGGKLWVNVPANSPAPDHIFLFEGIEHAADIVRQAGLDPQDTKAFPMTGATLEKAEKHKLSVTCVLTAHKPSA